MARQRFIHPEIWTDPSVGSLRPIERLFFIGCFSNADDEGRLLANPAYLRSTIFPYDDLTLDEVKTIRDNVVKTCKNVVLYEVNGVEYIAFLKWKEYQKPKYPKPSKLPPPPADPIPDLVPETVNEDGTFSGNISETFPKDFSKTEESLPENSSLGRVRVGYGLGRDRDGLGLGSDDDAASSAADPPPPDLSDYEKACLHELKNTPGYPFDYQKDTPFIRELMIDFPELHVLQELKTWRARKIDEPLTKKTKPRAQIRNWFNKAEEWRKERLEKSKTSIVRQKDESREVKASDPTREYKFKSLSAAE